MDNKIYPRCKFDSEQDYISADGYVMPCCWIGNLPHVESYFEIFKDCLEEMSVHHRSLKEIVADPRYLRIEQTWENEPFKPCRSHCGKPLEPNAKMLGKDKVRNVFEVKKK
jgi:hypothetical protein